ncbi:MAG: carbohydrate-binding domain-containing protein [Clostridiales bacterium]|nr:carbohydrate-binding domain-containing protein [Clostridiales bacterium]
MKNKALTKKIILTIAVCAVLAASIGAVAYFSSRNKTSTTASNQVTNNNTKTNSGNAASGTGNATVSNMALKITEKDNETTYDTADSTLIDLADTTGQVKITEAGTYIVTGKTDDGMIIIEVDPENDDVHLILRDATINSASSAAIYVKSADEVYITLEGENTLGNGGKYEAIDENDIDSVIYAKDDLTINGSGSLSIDATVGHAIVCKDDMVITGGTYNITTETDAINTNDSLAITSGTFNITAGDDAIHTDGILQIDNGTFEINAAEGLEGTYITINDGTFNINASDDGINAAQKVEDYLATLIVNGGNIKITMGAGDTDGIDSNGDIYINGGTIDITGQSTVDYDGTAVKNGGTLIINGVETDTIPNQFMGGPGGMQGSPNGGQNGNANFPGGNFDPDNMPADFDPNNMPADFDPNNMPADFDPNNMPADFDPNNMPGNMPGNGNRPDRGSNGKTDDSESVYNSEKNKF